MLDLIAPWADWITTGCLCMFVPALIPTIWEGRRKQHVPLSTSIPLTVGQAGIGLAVLSVGLTGAAALAGILTVLWATVAGERLRDRFV